jgi:hypothetical protein
MSLVVSGTTNGIAPAPIVNSRGWLVRPARVTVQV